MKQMQGVQLTFAATLLLLLLIGSTSCYPQLFYQPHAYNFASHQATAPVAAVASARDYAHPSVVRNAAREAELPPELQKSARFYNNPAIAAALAKESWPTDKEMIVVDREAEKIPREMVYKIFKNAGWVRRR